MSDWLPWTYIVSCQPMWLLGMDGWKVYCLLIYLRGSTQCPGFSVHLLYIRRGPATLSSLRPHISSQTSLAKSVLSENQIGLKCGFHWRLVSLTMAWSTETVLLRKKIKLNLKFSFRLFLRVFFNSLLFLLWLYHPWYWHFILFLKL